MAKLARTGVLVLAALRWTEASAMVYFRTTHGWVHVRVSECGASDLGMVWTRR